MEVVAETPGEDEPLRGKRGCLLLATGRTRTSVEKRWQEMATRLMRLKKRVLALPPEEELEEETWGDAKEKPAKQARDGRAHKF